MVALVLSAVVSDYSMLQLIRGIHHSALPATSHLPILTHCHYVHLLSQLTLTHTHCVHRFSRCLLLTGLGRWCSVIQRAGSQTVWRVDGHYSRQLHVDPSPRRCHHFPNHHGMQPQCIPARSLTTHTQVDEKSGLPAVFGVWFGADSVLTGRVFVLALAVAAMYPLTLLSSLHALRYTNVLVSIHHCLTLLVVSD